MEFSTYKVKTPGSKRKIQARKLTHGNMKEINRFVLGTISDDEQEIITGKGEYIRVGDYVFLNGIGYSILRGAEFEEVFRIVRV